MTARLIGMSIICSFLMTCTGCGSLSLFSDRHVNYHGSDKVDEKVTNLEKRLEALEKANEKANQNK